MSRHFVDLGERIGIAVKRRAAFIEQIQLPGAVVRIVHRRPKDWKKNARTGLLEPDVRFRADPRNGLLVPDHDSYDLLDEQEIHNQITNSGRDFLHQQGYQTTGLGTNGLNWIAWTNTAITPGAGDTTLSGEITTNGLARAQGTVAHTAGTNTTTVDKTFTCATAAQAAQAAALFTASSAGTMNHELTFTQRSLQVGDTIDGTWTITLG